MKKGRVAAPLRGATPFEQIIKAGRAATAPAFPSPTPEAPRDADTRTQPDTRP